MKAMSKAVMRRKEEMEYERKQKELQEKLAKMTPEEREEYEKECEERRKKVKELLMNYSLVSSMVPNVYGK
jgi:cell division protein FtsN